MSGPPKRAYEDSVHSSTSKYLHEDIGGSFPNIVAKVMSPSANEYHTTYEMGSDPRMAKIPRMESRDADKRSSLHSMYCMPPSSIGSHSDNLSSSGNRIENRDAKDTKVEGRDIRIEFKESLNEVRKETPISRSEKDVMFESRVEDGRELREVKYDKEIHDSKADIKVAEKDSYASPLTWKEHKEYHRTKRYHDNPGGNVDPWHIPHVNVHTSVEGGREGWPADMKAYVETNENVGENKVNLRNEDTFKDKDRKRKDVKFRDWGENKERNDRRGILLVCNSSSECKELREEREVDRWERERNFPKDKERPKEREKEYSKREAWNAPGNDVSKEKESVDGYSRMSEQENSASEQRKHKYFNGLRSADREVRERRKERNGDVEGDRPEKQSKQHAKELDDGHIDVEGNGERERDIFNYGVQQRKRMLRPRGSPQLPSREARYRSQMQENDGCHGKSEVALAVYKVGECLQELIRLWKEHESSKVFRMGENALNGPTLEIRIPAEHVTATNRQVRGGQLWGTDVYTDDSDLVAVLMHTGYCRPTASPPPSAIQELRATIRVLPPQDCYVSALRNNVRSRAWGAAIGCSYCVERCCIVKKGGGSIDLEPCLTHTSTVEPTLAPAAVERTMTTRAAASNALRQQKFVREVTIQYNLCSEPWIKYSISMVADKGLKKPLYTSARLKKGEVLYLETHSQRYELCFAGERVVRNSAASQNHETDGSGFQITVSHSTVGEKNSMDSENSLMDVFRWSRCKKPLPQKVMHSVGIPLPLEYVEVLEDNLDWEEVRWSQTGVWIAGKEYPLARVHFLSPN